MPVIISFVIVNCSDRYRAKEWQKIVGVCHEQFIDTHDTAPHLRDVRGRWFKKLNLRLVGYRFGKCQCIMLYPEFRRIRRLFGQGYALPRRLIQQVVNMFWGIQAAVRRNQI